MKIRNREMDGELERERENVMEEEETVIKVGRNVNR